MKRAMLAAAAILISAGVASAAPGYGKKGHGPGWGGSGHGSGYSRVTPRERAAIASARAHLNTVKARAWRDGKVTSFERYQIRTAENRLQRLVLRARYS